MSYILDALKKSEQERQQAEREKQDNVNAALAYDAAEPKKTRSYGKLVVLILIVNIALGAYVYLKDDGIAPGPIANVDKQQQKDLAKPKPNPKPKKAIESAVKDKVQIAKAAPKKVVKKPAKPKRILRSESNKRLAERAALAKAKEKAKSPKTVKKVDVKKQQDSKLITDSAKQVASIDTKKQKAKQQGRLSVPSEVDAGSVKKQRKKVAKPKGLTRTRVGVEKTNTRVTKTKSKPKVQSKPKTSSKVVFSKVELTADPNDVPQQVGSTTKKPVKPKVIKRPRVANFMDMDPDFRRTFPKIDINVHVYDSNPNDRFALIEMKRYGEGDTLSGGIKIKEITPEGFVIVYKNKTFHYPAK